MVWLPCCVNWTTAAGSCVETATGVAPTAGIFISAPCGKLIAAVVIVDVDEVNDAGDVINDGGADVDAAPCWLFVDWDCVFWSWNGK